MRDRLRSLERVTIGVRPHALRSGAGPIRTRVSSCQWLGDQTHIAAELGTMTVVSVSHDKIRAPAGQELLLSIQPSDLHLFDTDTGRALAHGGVPA